MGQVPTRYAALNLVPKANIHYHFASIASDESDVTSWECTMCITSNEHAGQGPISSLQKDIHQAAVSCALHSCCSGCQWHIRSKACCMPAAVRSQCCQFTSWFFASWGSGQGRARQGQQLKKHVPPIFDHPYQMYPG